MEEIEFWKVIKDHEDYLISNLGRVKSIKFNRETILKPSTTSNPKNKKKSYYFVCLSKHNKCTYKTVHVLVAEAFLNYISIGNHDLVVDHIDNNSFNNKVSNLQITTNRINCSKDIKQGSSKYIGVHWRKDKEKWKAQIKFNHKSISLGVFNNEEEASLVYKKACNDIINNIFDPDLYIKEREERSNKERITNRIKNPKGFTYSKNKKKWRAYVIFNNKKLYLGYFLYKEDAVNIYRETMIEIRDDVFTVDKFLIEKNKRTLTNKIKRDENRQHKKESTKSKTS